MKKLIFSAAVLASAFFAASCQQEEFAPAAEGNVVTFEVSIPEVVATKAGEGYQADGSNVNDLVYAVYSTTAETLEDAQKGQLTFFYAVNETSGKSFNDEGKSVVSLELLNDQNYLILFWAQSNDAWVKATGSNINLLNVTYPTSMSANNEHLEAFSGVSFIKNVKGARKETVTLTRPFAQINLATTMPQAFSANLSQSEMTVAKAAESFNVATQLASGEKTVSFTAANVPVADFKTGYTYAGANYIFANGNVDVTYKIYTSHGNVENIVPAVPVEKNYRTNILGNLLTSQTEYTVTLEDDWAGAEKDVLVTEVTSNTTLQEALHQNLENIVIDLCSDKIETRAAAEPAEYVVNPTENQGGKFVWGGANTKTITINGNGNKLNFNYTNGDSQSIKCVNPEAKIIINNTRLTNSGTNDGPWNRHDIYFVNPVELNDVISDKAIALRSDSKLANVSISDVHPGNSEAYGIWIVPVGQTVDLDRVTITPSAQKTTDRAIKIDKQYVNTAEIAQVTLNVKNSTFVSQKKAAVLVNSPAGAIINWREGNNIEGVAEDPINAVWVDDGATGSYDNVVVNGATKVLEGTQKAVLVKTAGELQNAVNNAVAGVNEIGFGADITGYVTIPQNDKINIIINGLGKKYDGTITVDGNSRSGGAETLVIKNINFQHSGSDLYFVEQNIAQNYPHNVTVEDCTFKGDGTNVICGIRYRQGFNNVAKNCTAEGLYLFMWTTGGNKITIDNVDVKDSYREGGFSLGQCNEFTVKNSKIVASDPSGYGIRLSASMPSTATIENCDITSFIPVMVREASKDQTLTFNGTNTMTASNTDNIWCAIGTSAYTTNGTMPTPATGRVTVVLNDAGLTEAGVYGNFKPVAKIGEKAYATVYEAIMTAEDDDTVTLIEDAELTFIASPQYNPIKAEVIDLNGKTLTIKNTDIRYQNTTIKNGNIVVDPSVSSSTAIFYMHNEYTLTLKEVEVVATGVSGTYLIGLEGKSNLNLIDSEIIIDNPSLVNLVAAIACNGSGMTTVKNSNVYVKNINGRAFLNTSCSVVNSTVTADYVKAGFYIPNGKKLSIDATSTVTITNLVDGKVNGIDLYGNAEYNVADGATVNATVGRN